MYCYCTQCIGTPHNVNLPLASLEENFGQQFITSGFWPSRSPDMNLCNYYLWVALSGRVCVWTVHTLCKNRKTVFKRKYPLFKDKSSAVSRNICIRCKACLESRDQHFETVIWNDVGWIAGEIQTLHSQQRQALYVTCSLYEWSTDRIWGQCIKCL